MGQNSRSNVGWGWGTVVARLVLFDSCQVRLRHVSGLLRLRLRRARNDVGRAGEVIGSVSRLFVS
jgi:hypothetical protein